MLFPLTAPRLSLLPIGFAQGDWRALQPNQLASNLERALAGLTGNDGKLLSLIQVINDSSPLKKILENQA